MAGPWSDSRWVRWPTLACFVGGNFNVISNLQEYSGRSEPDLVGMSEFNTELSQCALSELPVSGGIFTWTGIRRGGRVWSYLAPLVPLTFVLNIP